MRSAFHRTRPSHCDDSTPRLAIRPRSHALAAPGGCPRVVGFIALELARPAAPAPRGHANRGQVVHQCLHQHPVRNVRRGQQHDGRRADAVVAGQVQLAPELAAVDRGCAGCAPLCAQAGRVDADPAKVDAAGLAEPVQQHQAELVEYPGALPFLQPPPRGRRTAAAKLTGGQRPRGGVRPMNTSAAKQLRSGTTRRRPCRGAGGSSGSTSAQSSAGTRRSTSDLVIADMIGACQASSCQHPLGCTAIPECPVSNPRERLRRG